jgi:hypothetical protein
MRIAFLFASAALVLAPATLAIAKAPGLASAQTDVTAAKKKKIKKSPNPQENMKAAPMAPEPKKGAYN